MTQSTTELSIDIENMAISCDDEAKSSNEHVVMERNQLGLRQMHVLYIIHIQIVNAHYHIVTDSSKCSPVRRSRWM